MRINEYGLNLNQEPNEQGLYEFVKDNGDGTHSIFACDPDEEAFYKQSLSAASLIDSDMQKKARRRGIRDAYRVKVLTERCKLKTAEEAIQ